MNGDAEPRDARSAFHPTQQIVSEFEILDRVRQREIARLHDERFILRNLDRAHRFADRLGMSWIDKAVAAVFEDHEGGAEAEIDRNRAELPRKIGLRGDLDSPLFHRPQNIAV